MLKAMCQTLWCDLPHAVSCIGHRHYRQVLPLRCASTVWWCWCGSWCSTGQLGGAWSAAGTQEGKWHVNEKQVEFCWLKSQRNLPPAQSEIGSQLTSLYPGSIVWETSIILLTFRFNCRMSVCGLVQRWWIIPQHTSTKILITHWLDNLERQHEISVCITP